MTKHSALTPDELTVLLFCLTDYRDTVAESEEESDQLLEAFYLSCGQAEELISEICSTRSLSAELCRQASNALSAWRALSRRKPVPVEYLHAKLLAM